jgi:non-ribosomal peptide synthetase component F
VACPVANRERPEIAGLIGYFVNTLTMRTDLTGDPTFGRLLGDVRSVASGALRHQQLPFGKLVEALRPGAMPDWGRRSPG